MLIIIIAGVAVVALIAMSYNHLVHSTTIIDDAEKQIDVQLQRRSELIPNLINTVKGYSKHEAETLEKTIGMRYKTLGDQSNSITTRMQANNQIADTLGHLFAVSENYPDLKADSSFIQLEEELANTANQITFARQHTNDAVRDYEESRRRFPTNLIAGLLGFHHREYLPVPESAKENVKVEF